LPVNSHTNDVAVSVIVAFRNAERDFHDLLESLTAQTIDERWEILAVDNRSTDRSRQIAEQFTSRLPLAIIEAPARANRAYARNVGVAASSSDHLVFIDADDTVNPDYVRAMVRALREHELVTSRVDSITLNPEWVRGAHGPAWQADGVDVLYGFLPAAGVNIGIHRSLYGSLGGFPEEYAFCEDTAFSWNAHLRRRIPLHFVPDAVYRYRYRDTLPKLFRQSSRWGQASVQLFRQYRTDGMPDRPVRTALEEWRAVISALPRASNREARAPLVVRLGYCVGRVKGSFQHRVLFL
jgi:glycosyltransferase involved in cell wall biosynthesis